MGTVDKQEALVVTTYGRRVDVRLQSGERVAARIKGRKLKPVCGDRVTAQPIAGEPDWLITDILPRSNALTRPDARGRTEVLAANLTLVVVVAADPPTPDWFVVDRYLSAAELMGVKAAVLFNKIDRLTDARVEPPALAEFEKVGYPVLRCSAATGQSMADLQRLIAGETTILVGQSGVGKSSLINRLTDNPALRIGAVSAKSGEGRHTTVNSALLEVPSGGAVIDSPGVRDFAPAVESAQRVVAGFPEIEEAGRACRYANCRHLKEPGCAVKAALDEGAISSRRYESYKRLKRLTEKLNA